MASNIKINLLRNKPKYTANLGENNYRVYTPGEVITGQADFMRFVAEEDFLTFSHAAINSDFSPF
jgi:hypothetical protein